MLYYYCANDRNIGDYLSLLGVQEAVGLTGETRYIERDPQILEQEFQSLSATDSLIIGGGGLLKDTFAAFWIMLLHYQQEIGFQYSVFGIGVCSHKNKNCLLPNPLLERITRTATVASLRPPQPEALVQHPEIRSTYCPSLLYIHAQYGQKRRSSNANRCLLYVDHPDLIGAEASQLAQQNIRKICSDLGMEFRSTNNICQDSADLHALVQHYQQADIVVTTRLHGYILATALQKPTLAISNDLKLEGHASLLGLAAPLELEVLNYPMALREQIQACNSISDNKLNQAIRWIEREGRRIRDAHSTTTPATDVRRWQSTENLSPAWDARTERMAKMIPAGSSVLEFGAGRRVLAQHLPESCRYTPSDLTDRGQGTLICDLNGPSLPHFPAHDVAVFSGVLEYVQDVPRLLKHLATSCGSILASYAVTDPLHSQASRRANGWLNDYSTDEFRQLFVDAGYAVGESQVWGEQEIVSFRLMVPAAS